MPTLVLAAALGSIVITALLAFALWRMNTPRGTRRGDEGGHVYAGGGDSARRDHDMSDGGDGGGDGGGGGD